MIFARTVKAETIPLLVAMTLALGAAWFSELALGDSWPTRAGVWLVCLVAASAASYCGLFRSSAEAMTASRYIESLCRLDHHDLADPQVRDSLPRVTHGSAWQSILDRVRDRLVEWGNRADEAEHSLTACEVRLRRLENEHLLLRDILDRVTEPILTVNHYGELTFSNQAARELLGIAETEDGKVTVPAGPLNELLAETRRRKNGSQRNAELEIVAPSGHKRWFRIATRAFQERVQDQGKSQGALAVLTDISTERGIQQRHAEFVSSAAHELKTPLASVRAYVELLQDGAAEEEATRDEFLGVIATQTERLQRLIENLLNLARIEAGVVKVEKKDFSLNELLEHAFHVVQPTAEQKPLEFLSDLSPLHLNVFVDRDMLVQAAINLLSNAVKYTPAQGKVVLRSRLDDHAAIFEVEDTGVGLSPEDCEKVFERFYRVRKDQQMAPGTGLGLALVKHIVEDVHGGSVTVTSQPGKGSTFRVTLPTVLRSRS